MSIFCFSFCCTIVKVFWLCQEVKKRERNMKYYDFYYDFDNVTYSHSNAHNSSKQWLIFMLVFEREIEKDSSLDENIPLFNWISRLDDRKGLSIGIRECKHPLKTQRERESIWMCKRKWFFWFDKIGKMFCESRLKHTESQHAQIKLPSFKILHAPIPYFFVYVRFIFIWLRFCLLPSAQLKIFNHVCIQVHGIPSIFPHNQFRKMWKGPQIPSGPVHKVYSPVYTSTHTHKLFYDHIFQS